MRVLFAREDRCAATARNSVHTTTTTDRPIRNETKRNNNNNKIIIIHSNRSRNAARNMLNKRLGQINTHRPRSYRDNPTEQLSHPIIYSIPPPIEKTIVLSTNPTKSISEGRSGNQSRETRHDTTHLHCDWTYYYYYFTAIQ
jgi:hypothetical protein